MNRKSFSAAVATALLAAGSAGADFSFEQTTRITGGAMAGMMKFAGAFSKQAREPMRSTVTIKGDRMAMISANRINIIDLGAETMTDVDLDKKTYAVITFAEFGRAMQKLSEKMGQKNNDAQVSFKADVKQTGATRTINGLPAKETVLTITVEGEDKKNGNQGAMNVVSDMWLAPNLPGYNEVQSFYARMAQKMAFTPGMGGFGAMMGQQAGMAKAFAEVSKEAAKMNGVPVLHVVRVGGSVNGMSEADMARAQETNAQAQQQPQAPPPTAGGVAESAATGAATSAATSRMGRLGGLAGGLGGVGGFGRRKKEEQPATQTAQQAPPAATASAPPSPAGATPAGTLMELTTELTGFSSAPVEAAKLTVPSGFKQIEHDMAKSLK